VYPMPPIPDPLGPNVYALARLPSEGSWWVYLTMRRGTTLITQRFLWRTQPTPTTPTPLVCDRPENVSMDGLPWLNYSSAAVQPTDDGRSLSGGVVAAVLFAALLVLLAVVLTLRSRSVGGGRGRSVKLGVECTPTHLADGEDGSARTVTLDTANGHVGITLSNRDDRDGVHVDAVHPADLAYKAGIRGGDIVLGVGGLSVNDHQAAIRIMAQSTGALSITYRKPARAFGAAVVRA